MGNQSKVAVLRFHKELRERKLRDGATDRFWCVIDRNQNNFVVLRICVAYPGAELVAGAYALKLNSAPYGPPETKTSDTQKGE